MRPAASSRASPRSTSRFRGSEPRKRSSHYVRQAKACGRVIVSINNINR